MKSLIYEHTYRKTTKTVDKKDDIYAILLLC